MRILHVITSLSIGGAERLMTILLPQLRDLGHEVELLVFNGTPTAFTDSLVESGIKIHSLDSKNVYSPTNITKLRKYIGKYDIIHTHNTACQLFVPIARKLCCGRKAILITTEHNTTNRRRDKKWLKPLDKWMYSQYKTAVCIGESTEQNLKNYIGNKVVATCVIHNGIELPQLKADKPSIDNEIIISMVAAFRPQKNQDCLVRAISLLPERYHLRLIGDGERRCEVEQLVNTLGLSDRVEFLGNRSDVEQLLRDSHINVLSSHWEGFGLSAIEGMAVGVPTIVSDVPGLSDIVVNYGRVFPDNDYKTLAKEIEALINDKTLYDETAEKCRKRAEEFDIVQTAKKYNELYMKLCPQNQGLML